MRVSREDEQGLLVDVETLREAIVDANRQWDNQARRASVRGSLQSVLGRLSPDEWLVVEQEAREMRQHLFNLQAEARRLAGPAGGRVKVGGLIWVNAEPEPLGEGVEAAHA